MDLRQRRYLEGFFAGLRARGLSLSNGQNGDAPILVDGRGALDGAEPRNTTAVHPLDEWLRLLAQAAANCPPDADDAARLQWHGVFDLAAEGRDGCMLRLRAPGGRLLAYQLRELAALSQDCGSGFIQIGQRAEVELRIVPWPDIGEALRRARLAGLTGRCTGGNAVWNVVASPVAGIVAGEVFDVTPLAAVWDQMAIESRELADLPGPMRVTFDGGAGLPHPLGAEDLLWRAAADGFRVEVAGRDQGVFVNPSHVVASCEALALAYRRQGGPAGWKDLCESMGEAGIVAELESYLETKLVRASGTAAVSAAQPCNDAGSLLGFHAQKQAGLYWLGLAVPHGRLLTRHLTALAAASETYGSGGVCLGAADQPLVILHGVALEHEGAVREQMKVLSSPVS